MTWYFCGKISCTALLDIDQHMKPLAEVSTNFTQRGHRALLITLLLMIIVSPFVQQFTGFQWTLAVFLALVLLTAVRTVANKPHQYYVALVLAVIALLPQLGVLFDGSHWMEMTRLVSMVLFLVWVCLLLLRDIIVRSHTVTTELIFGAINVYLMVGLAFAFVYSLLEFAQPGSFTGLGGYSGKQGSVNQFMYFSFITLSTLGYGDITPLTPFASTASYVQAIFGQLYLAILVARLVGLYISRPSEIR